MRNTWKEFVTKKIREVLPSFNPNREPNEKRKIIDLIASPGKISAKVFTGLKEQKRIEIRFTLFEEDFWDTITDELSKSYLSIAEFLGGSLPLQLIEICEKNSKSLLFGCNKFSFYINAELDSIANEDCDELCLKIVNYIEENPFLLLAVYGKSQEELIREVSEKTAKIFNLNDEGDNTLDLDLASISDKISEQDRHFTFEEFWHGKEINFIAKNIVADDLPGKTYRQLGPIQIDGVEADLFESLDRAYIEIAKRAQAYAIDI